jgi:tyrosine-protein kinase Etk/Wzc
MMAPNSPKPQEQQFPMAADEMNLIDFLIAFAKRKKLLLGLPVLFAACATLASLSMPNIYRATTKILPSQQNQSSAVAMLNQLGGFAGITPGALSIRIPTELFISMLKSRTVADNIIHRFDLQKEYGVDTLDATRQILARNTKITSGKDNLIAIEVDDNDPKRAAQIANAFVDEILKLTKRMTLTEASHRRVFIERRLQSLKDQLAEAEVAFKSVQGARGMSGGDGKARELAERAARLLARISAKEIQLGAMQAFVNVNNQEYNRGQQEIGAMRAELARLESGGLVVRGSEGSLEAQAWPDGIRILHDVKYYQMLHDLLAKQYEAARLDEAKDASIIEVLDKAVEPERHIKPERSKKVLGAALFGLLIAIFWVLIVDLVQIGKRPGEVEKLRKLKSYLGFR